MVMSGSVELYHVNVCRQLSSYWYQSNQTTSVADGLINYPLTLTCENTPLRDTLCTLNLFQSVTTLPFIAFIF